MINYTTPTLYLTVEDLDITSHEVYVSLEQGRTELTKSGSDISMHSETEQGKTNTYIEVLLSQEETAMFNWSRPCDVQVNWITASDIRAATFIETIPVMRNLLDKVVHYGDNS